MPHAAAVVGREDGAWDQMISSRRTRVKTLTRPTPTKAAGNGQPPNRFRICDIMMQRAQCCRMAMVPLLITLALATCRIQLIRSLSTTGGPRDRRHDDAVRARPGLVTLVCVCVCVCVGPLVIMFCATSQRTCVNKG
jgi:hypothetical protein